MFLKTISSVWMNPKVMVNNCDQLLLSVSEDSSAFKQIFLKNSIAHARKICHLDADLMNAGELWAVL